MKHMFLGVLIDSTNDVSVYTLVCVFLLPGSSRAAAGFEGGYGAAGEEQNSTLHPLHAARYRKLPQRHQCEL